MHKLMKISSYMLQWHPRVSFLYDQKDDKNMRILQKIISSIPLYGALEPECEILVFMWSFGSYSVQPYR